MAYRRSGKVLHLGEMQTLPAKSGNLYTRRELVITVRKFDPYTGFPTDDTQNTPKFIFFGQQCQQLEQLKPGDIVVVHFDISGRTYEKDGKTEYFTEVRPFKVEISGSASQQAPAPIQQSAQQPSQAVTQPPQAPQYPQQSNTIPPMQTTVTDSNFGFPVQDDDLPF